MFAQKALINILEAAAKIEKDRDRAFVAVNKPEKEIFIMDYDAYDDDIEEGEEDEGHVSVSYEKDFGYSSGEEAYYEVEESMEECPGVEVLFL